MRISRRRAIAAGLGAVAGASGLAVAARLAERYGLVPPRLSGVYGAGETLTYAAQRLFTGHSLAREFSRAEISKVSPVSGDPPHVAVYRDLLAGKFADWRLRVEGLVDRPASFSLAELQSQPQSSHITMHVCEEGWSYIAEWTGVRLSEMLGRVGASAGAKYVVFFPYDENAFGVESLDMADALHPQTLLAYGMNGRDLTAEHGAPVRMRVARQLGYKSVKYLSRVLVTDSLDNLTNTMSTDLGYSWYAGI